MNRRGNVFGGIVKDVVLYIAGLPFGKVFEFGPYGFHGIQGIGVRRSVDADRQRRLAVKYRPGEVGFSAEFHPGHIANSYQTALIIAANDDVFKFFRIVEASLGPESVLELLAAFRRRCSDGPHCSLDVLLPDGRDHVIGGQASGGEPLRVHPDAHAVFKLTENKNITDAVDPHQGVFYISADIVAQKQLVPRTFGRKEFYCPQYVRGSPADINALIDHRLGKFGGGQLDPVLQVDLIDVRIGAYFKGNGQGISPVVGTGGGHVEHFFHTIDFLFNGGGDIVGNNLGIGARVSSGDPDLRRRDIRVLGNGNVEQRNESGQGDDDGYHHGKARAFDEYL